MIPVVRRAARNAVNVGWWVGWLMKARVRRFVGEPHRHPAPEGWTVTHQCPARSCHLVYETDEALLRHQSKYSHFTPLT